MATFKFYIDMQMAIALVILVVANSTSQTVHLDDLNRIISLEYSNYTVHYAYDKLGNRLGYTITSSGCSKIVSVLSNTDAGSLRAAIQCASSGDTIQFAATLQSSGLELDRPTIIVDKELYILAPMTFDITLSNKEPTNTDVLLSISDDLYIDGLKLIGKREDSMILKIEPGGSLILKNVEVERVDVRN